MKKGPQGGISAGVVALIGKRFGRWSVESYAGTRGKARAPHFNCICECGTFKVVKGEYLSKGKSKSCGCLRKEITGNTFRTHGHSVNRKISGTYISWQGMFKRCYLPHSRDYKWYGALGVVVCDRWKDFTNFLADMGVRPEGLTLDRIDPFGNYEPNNCRWATWETQRQNKRSNHES